METNERFEYIVSTMKRYRMLWIAPAIAGVLLAIVYSILLKSETWTARQTLIVRDDMLGHSYKPGQFQSLESMKSAQETLLEVARKPQVIRNALVQLGPPSTGLLSSSATWPSEETIEDTQNLVSFSAPNGGEFGRTEVVILNVKQSTRDRSRKFIDLMLDEIDKKLSDVRIQRLQSMEAELSQARDAAALSLDESLRKMRRMEKGLGPDVTAMNGMTSPYGTSGNKLELAQIRQELRVAENELDSALNTQEMLLTAHLNPEKSLAGSSEFLATNPTLAALQTTKVKAQETYAMYFGQYQETHPVLQASLQTIAAMDDQIYLELENLTRGIETHIVTIQSKIRRLNEAKEAELARLSSLGEKRVDHLTINSEVEKKQEIFQAAQSALFEVQTLRVGAGEVEWLTRVDAPQVSTRPDGMGKKATVLGGGICGLMIGIGLVMLVAPPMERDQRGRPGRRSDLPRRSNDFLESISSTSEAAESIELAETPGVDRRKANDLPGSPSAVPIQSTMDPVPNDESPAQSLEAQREADSEVAAQSTQPSESSTEETIRPIPVSDIRARTINPPGDLNSIDLDQVEELNAKAIAAKTALPDQASVAPLMSAERNRSQSKTRKLTIRPKAGANSSKPGQQFQPDNAPPTTPDLGGDSSDTVNPSVSPESAKPKRKSSSIRIPIFANKTKQNQQSGDPVAPTEDFAATNHREKVNNEAAIPSSGSVDSNLTEPVESIVSDDLSSLDPRLDQLDSLVEEANLSGAADPSMKTEIGSDDAATPDGVDSTPVEIINEAITKDDFPATPDSAAVDFATAAAEIEIESTEVDAATVASEDSIANGDPGFNRDIESPQSDSSAETGDTLPADRAEAYRLLSEKLAAVGQHSESRQNSRSHQTRDSQPEPDSRTDSDCQIESVTEHPDPVHPVIEIFKEATDEVPRQTPPESKSESKSESEASEASQEPGPPTAAQILDELRANFLKKQQQKREGENLTTAKAEGLVPSPAGDRSDTGGNQANLDSSIPTVESSQQPGAEPETTEPASIPEIDWDKQVVLESPDGDDTILLDVIDEGSDTLLLDNDPSTIVVGHRLPDATDIIDVNPVDATVESSCQSPDPILIDHVPEWGTAVPDSESSDTILLGETETPTVPDGNEIQRREEAGTVSIDVEEALQDRRDDAETLSLADNEGDLPRNRQPSVTIHLDPEDLPFAQSLQEAAEDAQKRVDPSGIPNHDSALIEEVKARLNKKNIRPVDIARSARDETHTFVPAEDTTSAPKADPEIQQPMDALMESGMPIASDDPEDPDSSSPHENGVRDQAATTPIEDPLKNLGDSLANLAKRIVPRRKDEPKE